MATARGLGGKGRVVKGFSPRAGGKDDQKGVALRGTSARYRGEHQKEKYYGQKAVLEPDTA